MNELAKKAYDDVRMVKSAIQERIEILEKRDKADYVQYRQRVVQTLKNTLEYLDGDLEVIKEEGQES